MKFTLASIAVLATSAVAFQPRLSTRSTTALQSSLQRETGRSQLDPAVIQRYNDLPFPDNTILAEYVWVDAVGNTRSKTRTLPAKKVSRQKDRVLSNCVVDNYPMDAVVGHWRSRRRRRKCLWSCRPRSFLFERVYDTDSKEEETLSMSHSTVRQ